MQKASGNSTEQWQRPRMYRTCRVGKSAARLNNTVFDNDGQIKVNAEEVILYCRIRAVPGEDVLLNVRKTTTFKESKSVQTGIISPNAKREELCDV
ncbi:hypothetical protein RUM44_002409 [Polyplax serrata]|uniref:Uncharacterized protein n=1 Tax=Polyplax serrata TaxID=468196 RepID=A0ABR1AG87_POLSC